MPVADERTVEDKSGKKVDGEFAVLNRPEKVSPENVTFEQNSDVIKITVDSSKHYGYIVFKITGAGYGTGTYSKTNYSDKYTLN